MDIDSIPFSYPGAWMSVSRLSGGRAPEACAGVYLKTHHGGGETPLLRLIPCGPDGVERGARLSAGPGVLAWESEEGAVACVFESPRVLRFRGQGLALRLEHHKLLVCHGDGPDRMTLNMRPVLRRYQVACLAGTLEWEGAWTAKRSIKPRVMLRAESASGAWEAALIEYGSTVPPLQHRPFAACRRAAAAAFEQWLEAVPPVRAEWEEARRLAVYVQWSCLAEPCGLIRRPAMFMSRNWMAKVWNWDNGFNAMSLAAQSRHDLAWDQFLLFMDHQDEYGCLPDTLTDLSYHFNFCKPPVHGWMLSQMLEHGAALPRETEAALYRGLTGWTRWWLTHRRRAGAALPFYLHGNDSGWDNSTLFDHGRAVIAPDLAAYLVLQCETLAAFARRQGETEAAAEWAREAGRIRDALIHELWDGNRFVGRLADEPDRIVRCESLLCSLPLLLGTRLPAEVRQTLVERQNLFLTGWGPATERPESEEYEADGYWRGPIWAPSTYLVVRGLNACGETALARDIAARYCRLCAAQGFAENYDALEGKALRDRGYTWSASVFLLLAAELEASAP